MFNESELNDKIKFIMNYIETDANPATLSKVDANANITDKNSATLMNELFKRELIQINRKMMYDSLTTLYGEDVAGKYEDDIESHLLYSHDESFPLFSYCGSVSMYPFLLHGMKKLGGESEAPQHIKSFCGGYINLVFALSAQFAGAVGTPEFLLYFDYFARKDFGDNYIATHEKEVNDLLKQVVYSINQPAAARGNQSVFVNMAVFDKYYFEGMFGGLFFPDGTRPKWETLDKLQRHFMRWFNAERTRAELTFPVVTVSLFCESETKDVASNETIWRLADKEYINFIAKELSEGNSFFIYMSDSIDSLSSCCRLQNKIDRKKKDFSTSIGGAGVDTGSIKVITINMNRLIQRHWDKDTETLKEAVLKVVARIHMYLHAQREIIKKLVANGMLGPYRAGFVSLDKQYSTIGINGMVEAAEYMGLKISFNDGYKSFLKEILSTITAANEITSEKLGFKINIEFVPAENLGVKNAKWDKEDGLVVNRDCYNSYFYIVEDDSIDILEKMKMHGGEIMEFLDGGSAYHINLEEHATAQAYEKLLHAQAALKSPYVTINVKATACNNCGYKDKQTRQSCRHCGSTDIDWITRIIGYPKRISSFSDARKIEESKRVYHKI